MGLYVDPHRIDSPNYRPPGRKDDSPPPMTVNGRTTAQDAAAAARAAAQAAMAKSETPAQLAFEVYQAAIDAQRVLNKQADAAFDEGKGQLSEKGWREKKSEILKSPPAAVVDIAEQAVRNRKAEADQRYQDLLAGMVNQGDAAEEARRTRYLGIVEREMAAAESQGGKVAAGQRMLETAKDDPSRLSLLVEQLPSMFAGTDTSWIETTLAQVNPRLGAAVTDCRRAAQAVAMSNYAAKSVRDGFESGMPPTQIGRLAAAAPKYDPDN